MSPLLPPANSGSHSKIGLGVKGDTLRLFTRVGLVGPLLIFCFFGGFQEKPNELISLVTIIAISCLYFWSFFSFFSKSWIANHAFMKGLQLSFDATFVVLLIAVTGAVTSPFQFLLLLIAMGGVYYCDRIFALAIALLSVMGVGAISYYMHQGVLPKAGYFSVLHLTHIDILVQLLSLLCAMTLVSLATEYVLSRIKSTEQDAQKTSVSLQQMIVKQRALLDGFPGGIAITDHDRRITFVNSQLQEWIGIDQDAWLNKEFKEVFGEIWGGKLPASFLMGVSQKQIELSVHDQQEQPLYLHYSSRVFPVVSTDFGSEELHIFQDFTSHRAAQQRLETQETMAKILAERFERSATSYGQLDTFIGETPIMKKVFQLIGRVSSSDATVLVHGESGTGKELVAKAIHAGSDRSSGPFVAINCGAIPEKFN